MDQMKHYHDIVIELVQQYAAEMKLRDGTRIEAVTDPQHGHYLVIRSGWKGEKYVHACLVHFAIRGREVQLLKNDTDIEWDRELLEQGVAFQDIVLGFRQQGRLARVEGPA